MQEPNMTTKISSETTPSRGTTIDSLKHEADGQAAYSDGSRPAAGSLPTIYNLSIWDLGWTDGRQGDEPSIRDAERYFVDEAKLKLEEQSGVQASQLAHLEIEAASLQEEVAARKRDLDRLDELERDLASHSFLPNPKSYLWVGIVLLLAAFVVSLADLPLSTQLAGKSFGFRDEVCVENGQITATPIEDCKAANIRQAQKMVFHPFDMATYFPEILALALGLSASGFLFKTCIDTFSRYYANRHEQWLKLAASGSVAGLAILTLGVLGVVRSSTFSAETEALRTQSENLDAQARQLRAKMASAQAAESDSNKRRLDFLEARKAVVDSQVKGRSGVWVLLGFVLLTILFPVGSGVLMFLGIRFLQRWSAQGRLDQRRSEIRAQLDRAVASLAKSRADLASQKHTQDKLNSSQAGEAIGKQWARVYEHGRERGANARHTLDSSKSAYERALFALRRKAIV